MGAGLNDLTAVHDKSKVREPGCGEAAGYDYGCLINEICPKPLQPLQFCPRIHGTGGLIEGKVHLMVSITQDIQRSESDFARKVFFAMVLPIIYQHV